MKSKVVIHKEDYKRNSAVRSFNHSTKKVRYRSFSADSRKNVIKSKLSVISSLGKIRSRRKTKKRSMIADDDSSEFSSLQGDHHAPKTTTETARAPPPPSAWGAMTVMQLDPENKAYDLTSHMVSILENQAVSQIERLRCELAARLQQITSRVDKALNNVGMGRYDKPMEPAPNKLVTHFDEEERRDVFMIRIKEHQLDSSERLRILQELYDWFNLTKDLVMVDVVPPKALIQQDNAISRFATNIDEAMVHTIFVVGKIKKLGHKLLISAGYIDRLGRRRHPPTIVQEEALHQDYSNNLDNALGVIRKCHEELSKTIKSPMLTTWVVTARRQMKNLAAAIVKKYVEYVKISKQTLEQRSRITSMTEYQHKLAHRIAVLESERTADHKKMEDYKNEIKRLDRMMMTAYDRTEYYEGKVTGMAADMEKISQKLFDSRTGAEEAKIMRDALRNMLTTPEGNLLGSKSETSGLTKGLQMESESTQTDDLKSGTGAPPGVVMVERNMLSKLQQELSVLKMFKTNVIKRDKEVDRVTNEILANQPGAQIQEEQTDQESKERRGSHGRERTKEGVVEDSRDKMLPPGNRGREGVRMDSKLTKRDANTLKLVNDQQKHLTTENERLLKVEQANKEEIQSLKGQFAAIDKMLRVRDQNMEEMQRVVIHDFGSFISTKRKILKNYKDGHNNARAMLKIVAENMTELLVDNRRLANYVKERIDKHYEGALKRWVRTARSTLGTQAMDAEAELRDTMDNYENLDMVKLKQSMTDKEKAEPAKLKKSPSSEYEKLPKIFDTLRSRDPEDKPTNGGIESQASSASYTFSDRPYVASDQPDDLDERIQTFKPDEPVKDKSKQLKSSTIRQAPSKGKKGSSGISKVRQVPQLLRAIRNMSDAAHSGKSMNRRAVASKGNREETTPAEKGTEYTRPPTMKRQASDYQEASKDYFRRESKGMTEHERADAQYNNDNYTLLSQNPQFPQPEQFLQQSQPPAGLHQQPGLQQPHTQPGKQPQAGPPPQPGQFPQPEQYLQQSQPQAAQHQQPGQQQQYPQPDQHPQSGNLPQSGQYLQHQQPQYPHHQQVEQQQSHTQPGKQPQDGPPPQPGQFPQPEQYLQQSQPQAAQHQQPGQQQQYPQPDQHPQSGNLPQSGQYLQHQQPQYPHHQQVEQQQPHTQPGKQPQAGQHPHPGQFPQSGQYLQHQQPQYPQHQQIGPQQQYPQSGQHPQSGQFPQSGQYPQHQQPGQQQQYPQPEPFQQSEQYLQHPQPEQHQQYPQPGEPPQPEQYPHPGQPPYYPQPRQHSDYPQPGRQAQYQQNSPSGQFTQYPQSGHHPQSQQLGQYLPPNQHQQRGPHQQYSQHRPQYQPKRSTYSRLPPPQQQQLYPQPPQATQVKKIFQGRRKRPGEIDDGDMGSWYEDYVTKSNSRRGSMVDNLTGPGGATGGKEPPAHGVMMHDPSDIYETTTPTYDSRVYTSPRVMSKHERDNARADTTAVGKTSGTRRQSDTMRDRDYGVPRRGDLLNSGYDFYIGQPEDQIPYAPVTSQDGPKMETVDPNHQRVGRSQTQQYDDQTHSGDPHHHGVGRPDTQRHGGQTHIRYDDYEMLHLPAQTSPAGVPRSSHQHYIDNDSTMYMADVTSMIPRRVSNVRGSMPVTKPHPADRHYGARQIDHPILPAPPTSVTDQGDETDDYETLPARHFVTEFKDMLSSTVDADGKVIGRAMLELAASGYTQMKRKADYSSHDKDDYAIADKLPPLPPPQHPAAASVRRMERTSPVERKQTGCSKLGSDDGSVEATPRSRAEIHQEANFPPKKPDNTQTKPRTGGRKGSASSTAPKLSFRKGQLTSVADDEDATAYSQVSGPLSPTELQINSARFGLKSTKLLPATDRLESLCGEFDIDDYPAISQQAAVAIADRWKSMKHKVIAFLADVEKNVHQSAERHKREVERMNDEKRNLELSLINREEMLACLQAEKAELEDQLRRLEGNNKSLNHAMLNRRNKDDKKLSLAFEDVEGIKKDYKLCQAELRRMNAEFTEALTMKQELISDIRNQQQQFERIANLHKHLLGRLESYMLSNDMMNPYSNFSTSISKEEHGIRVDHLRSLCRSNATTSEMKKITHALTAHMESVTSDKERIESFIKNYIDLPISKTIELMRGQIVWKDLPDDKSNKLVTSLFELNRRIDDQVSNITNKLQSTGHKIIEGHTVSFQRLDGLSGDVSPPAYQSYASTGRGQQAMIREELIDEAARIVSSAVTSRSGAEQSGTERQHAGGDMKVLINGAPTVQGTSCLVKKPEIFWPREKSIVVDRRRWPTPLSTADQAIIDQAHTRWAEMEYKKGTKLDDLKGPKHQSRLKAVRGYFIDENIAPLPITSHSKSKPIKSQRRFSNKTTEFEPDCYGIPRCIESKAGASYKIKPENLEKSSIKCRSVDFVD